MKYGKNPKNLQKEIKKLIKANEQSTTSALEIRKLIFENQLQCNNPSIFNQIRRTPNRPLIEGELDEALSEWKGSSTGPDVIHYEFIKKLTKKHI
jgi:hypothetical protein